MEDGARDPSSAFPGGCGVSTVLSPLPPKPTLSSIRCEDPVRRTHRSPNHLTSSAEEAEKGGGAMPSPRRRGRRHNRTSRLCAQVLLSCGAAMAVLCLMLLAMMSVSYSPGPGAANSAAAVSRSKRHHHVHGPPSPVVPDSKLSDVFISVKTSLKFHRERLRPVLDTWFRMAREETWFFTDGEDTETQQAAGGHLRVTGCPDSHSRQALCCKMSAEFDAFLSSGKRWFCHFDDDNYVNVPALIAKLRRFDHRREWYLGKPSTSQPLEVPDREGGGGGKKSVSFWFATGGAGFCLSRPLAERMAPHAGGGALQRVCDRVRLPDDVTVGYVAAHLAGTPLTVVPEFHSHLEPLGSTSLSSRKIREEQISFSYSKGDEGRVDNVVRLEEGKEEVAFSEEEDPTRFYSLHCALFPNVGWCLDKKLGRGDLVQVP